MQQLFRPFNVVLSGNPLLHVTNVALAQHKRNLTTAKQLLQSISV
jgi:hypothetical protein